jgi:hypothetical protein
LFKGHRQPVWRVGGGFFNKNGDGRIEGARYV